MRKFYIKIAMIAFSLLVCVMVFEIILRAFFPIYQTGNIDAYKYDETLGICLKENIHYFKTTDYQQEILTNKIGTVNLQKSFNDYDILVYAVGDSYTQGSGLPVDASYPFQLSTMLNMQDGRYVKKYAIINLGLASFGTKQAFLSLLKYKEIIGKPDYILYLGSWNDHSDDVLFANGYRHKHLVYGNPHWGVLLRPIQWIANDFEIGKRMKLFVGNVRRRSYSKNDTHKKQNNKDNVSVAELQEDQLKDNASVAELQEDQLNKLMTISNKLNAMLIVSWADLPNSSSDSYNWLKQWAEKNKVAFADWHPSLKSVLQVIPELPIYNQHSGGHYRTWVNNIIAKAFAERFQN